VLKAEDKFREYVCILELPALVWDWTGLGLDSVVVRLAPLMWVTWVQIPCMKGTTSSRGPQARPLYSARLLCTCVQCTKSLDKSQMHKHKSAINSTLFLQVTCQSLSDYLTSTVNPYIANVTAATMLCSEVLCQGKGRCIRKSYNSPHYLHLNPTYFRILRAGRKYIAVGLPSAGDLNTWAENFTCQCYAGWSCSPKLLHPTTIKVIRV